MTTERTSILLLAEIVWRKSEPGGPPQTTVFVGLQALQMSVQSLAERYPSMGRPPVSHALATLRLSLTG
ncbi:hypothetical protein DPEC_G00274980 [Dallia pectoralis]|uniref:Uncharacterized protein n=1 Tax=Dallia pectoralis TaxID=75939 RepID=A0ACC2FL10_DALPE|nr:hypothetical protein DPEC_G00274980 [Dallia pectoralis]